MNSRERILANLRANRRPFDDAPPRPNEYVPVTYPVEGDLAQRFAAEMDEMGSHVHIVPDESAAIQTVLSIIGNERTVLAWETLPLPGLAEALNARQIRMISPRVHEEQRAAVLAEAERVRIGITGADAGIATTGTVALITGKGHGRLVSLVPPVYVALLRRERLFARLEDWMPSDGRAALKTSSSVVFLSGPSTSGDIEATAIRGVHGPGDVHVVVF